MRLARRFWDSSIAFLAEDANKQKHNSEDGHKASKNKHVPVPHRSPLTSRAPPDITVGMPNCSRKPKARLAIEYHFRDVLWLEQQRVLDDHVVIAVRLKRLYPA